MNWFSGNGALSKRSGGMHTGNLVHLQKTDTAEAAGVYLWDLVVDKVFADSAAAQAFGFDEDVARRGLPISQYLGRMHPDDLPRVAKAIYDAIVTGSPYQEEYRICLPEGGIVEVLALGTCFSNPQGEPTHYAGMVFPKEMTPGPETTIRQLCMTAYDLARKDGKSDVAEKLIDILATLGFRPFGLRLSAA